MYPTGSMILNDGKKIIKHNGVTKYASLHSILNFRHPCLPSAIHVGW